MGELTSALGARLQALKDAATLSRGRVNDEVVDAAETLVRRADERLSITGDHTVVALAGATGSGKSTAFNALSGTQLATAGVTRPTTSEAMAVAWGTELPAELLTWLDVKRRNLIAGPEGPFTNLVLLDLPDHDSTEQAHRLTVDRLVKVVDMMVWIVDPQKYADAALHDGYLKPLAGHAENMVVVLNQADRLNGEELDRALKDLRRLLDSEGLSATPVMAMSALHGTGVRELRQLLARVVSEKTMSSRRYGSDVTRLSEQLASELGEGAVPSVPASVTAQVTESMAEASGVPVVVNGVLEAWRHRGTLATGWPMVAWIKRFKPDPLRALRVGLDSLQLSPAEVSRTSLPKASAVQRARLDSSIRTLTDSVGHGVPRGWMDAIRKAARGNDPVLADKLDAAIARTDLRMGTGRGWWVAITVLQWVLFAALVGGLVWLLAPLVMSVLGWALPLADVSWFGFPAPVVLLVGGVAGGVVLALLSRLFVEWGARLKAGHARKALTASVGEVVDAEVVAPVDRELKRLSAARDAVVKARRI